MPFTEVWDAIRRMSTSRSEFSKFNKAESFEVMPSDNNEGLVINEGTTTELIPYHGILALWQQIRQSGFVAGNQLPYGLNTQSEYILPIMAELPYIERVVMADSYDDISSDTYWFASVLETSSNRTASVCQCECR